MKFDVILVDILKAVTSAMVVPDNPAINFQTGRNYQILNKLTELDNSITKKGTKYPLIALIQPVTETRGGEKYATVRIPRIVIATRTKSGDGNEDVLVRYEDGGSYKKTLYPCYNEFLQQLANSPYIENCDPDAFVHQKMDNPSIQPIGQGLSDYVDCIEILNLELTLIQIKKC